MKQIPGFKMIDVTGFARIAEIALAITLCLITAAIYLKICGDEMKHQIYQESPE